MLSQWTIKGGPKILETGDKYKRILINLIHYFTNIEVV